MLRDCDLSLWQFVFFFFFFFFFLLVCGGYVFDFLFCHCLFLISPSLSDLEQYVTIVTHYRKMVKIWILCSKLRACLFTLFSSIIASCLVGPKT